MAKDKYRNSPADDDWFSDGPVNIYSKDSRPKTPKTPADSGDFTSHHSYDDFDTGNSGDLNVYKTLTFTHKENPAGGIIYVQVDGKQVPVTMPVRLKNGDTVIEYGKGKANSRTGKRGDLHITVFFRSRPFPVIPLILCAVLVPTLIAAAAGLFGGEKTPGYKPGSGPDSGHTGYVDQTLPTLPPIQTAPTDPAPAGSVNPLLSLNPHFIGAGGRQTALILDNGTVIAEGEQRQGACKVTDWSNMQMISSGDFYTVGLRSDGVVVATGDNADGQCNINGWRDISFVTAGDFHSVAVTVDGKVVAAGRNDDGQCNVGNLKSGYAVAVAAGFRHTVVLYADGTVDAIGSNHRGQCDVDSWSNVVAVYCGANFTLGLCADGTVLATGDNADGQCDARYWSNVKLLAAGDFHSVAVTHDGRILTAGQNAAGQLDVYYWSGDQIFALGAGCRHTVAITDDGTIFATGENVYGQCDVRDYDYYGFYPQFGNTGNPTGNAGAAGYANARVGDVIRYGSWEQDDKYANGAEAIEWLVLEKHSDRMLVLSKYALENISFHNYSESVVWENCDLRVWLNNDFYQGAFTWDEQRNIILATVPFHENPIHDHGKLNDTQDYVFVLSHVEVERYFHRQEDRICYPTRHTQNSRDVWLGNGNSVWWWLRSPGEYADDATCVNSTGYIAYDDAHVSSVTGTVRPAMWLSIP